MTIQRAIRVALVSLVLTAGLMTALAALSPIVLVPLHLLGFVTFGWALSSVSVSAIVAVLMACLWGEGLLNRKELTDGP